MRQAINENRTVQVALLGVLALAVGLMLLKSTQGGGGEGGTDATATAPESTDTGAAPATGPAPAAPPTTVSSSAGATPAGAAASVPAELVPGPGLPPRLTAAWEHGKAVVLLVRRDGGIDDRLVRSSVQLLADEPRLAVFVTRARGIARYAWLTQGVNVTHLPALVVLRPRKPNRPPIASVDYGFRAGAGVVQAVKDALYRGPSQRPYHP